MSTQLHKSFRRVLNIENQVKIEGSLSVPVTIVTWATVERETSRSIYSKHIAITVYIKNRQHSHVNARIFNKAARIPKNLKDCDVINSLYKDLDRSYTHALYSYLGTSSKARKGSVVWYDDRDGVGMLKDAECNITIPFYACNFVKADSNFPELVTNVTVSDGDILIFKIDPCPYISTQCGATSLIKE